MRKALLGKLMEKTTASWNPSGEGGRGYSGFQVTGMIEGFFGGFEMFDFGVFFGYENLASIFLGSLI